MSAQEILNKAVEENQTLIFEKINGQLVLKVPPLQQPINSAEINFNQRITYRGVQETFLHIAIHHGNVSLVKNLVSHAKFLVNTGNEYNLFPLELVYNKLKQASASSNLQEIFSILLRHNSILKIIDLDPSIANYRFAADIVNLRLKYFFSNACTLINSDADLKEIRLLLSTQHPLDNSWVFEEENFLKWAAKQLTDTNYQVEKIADSLANALLDPQERQFFLNELLCISCFSKNILLVKFCINNGADINYRDSTGKTALHHAFTAEKVDKPSIIHIHQAKLNLEIVTKIVNANQFQWNKDNQKALDTLIAYNARDHVVGGSANSFCTADEKFYQDEWKKVVQFLIERSAPFTSDHLDASEALQIELQAGFDKGKMPLDMLANDERVKSWSMRPVTEDEQLIVAKFNYYLALGLAKIAMRENGALSPVLVNRPGYRIVFPPEPLICNGQQVLSTIAKDSTIEIHMGKDLVSLSALLKKFPNIAAPDCFCIDLTEGGRFTLQ